MNKIFDVIIIGSGGSGLTAGINLEGLNVAFISKVHPLSSHTVAAKGGINAALGNKSKDDWRWHMYDTIKGADWIGDEDAIEYMCENAKDAILYLEKIGVLFSRDESGKIYQRRYAGQSAEFGKEIAPERACAVKDQTGHAILHALYAKALQNCVFFNNHFAIDLITEGDICYGVKVWDIEKGIIENFYAKNTIISTGGYGQIYKTNTSSFICTGDGIAMAARAGVGLKDMEFVQFHPTGLYGTGILISEAARGEGGYLLNDKNERFMEKYAPQYLDLAPRDVISRSIEIEIKNQDSDFVYLKINHLDKNIIQNRLPSSLEVSKKFANIDPLKENIKVAPSAHYTMGGINVDINCKTHEYKNLFAIGEASCISVHGSNRLGCNGLLELIVFGRKCAEYIKNNQDSEFNFKQFNNELVLKGDKELDLQDILQSLQKIMSEKVGVVRNRESLEESYQEILQIEEELKNCKISSNLQWNNKLQDYLELTNMTLLAKATCYAALHRKESRGSHYREDFKGIDKKFRKHSLIKANNGTKELKFSYTDIRKSKNFNFEEKLRKY